MGTGPHEDGESEQGRIRSLWVGMSKSGLSREDGEQHPDWVGHGSWESWWEQGGLVLVNHANISLVKPHVNV